MDQPQPDFTLDEIGEHFGRLIGRSFAAEITLTKALENARADNAALSVEVDRLRHKLHQAEVDLIAAQGDAIIDGAKEKAANEAANLINSKSGN